MAGTIDRDRNFPKPVDYLYWALLIGGCAGILLTFLLRFWAVFSLYGLSATSGVEGPGSFGIFQVCSGHTPYQDLSTSSNIALYNFVFFELYGTFARLFGNCEITTPLFGRLLSAVLSIALAATMFCARDKKLHPLEAGAIALGAFSPFIGWWAFALRADIGAAAFLALCLVMMLSYLRSPRLLTALAVALFQFCSWGFKQTYIFAAPVLLWYIFRKDPRHALFFCVVLFLGISTPFLVYGIPYYLQTIYIFKTEPLVFAIGVANLHLFLAKAAPTLLLAALIIVTRAVIKWDLQWDFLVIMLILLFVMATITSAKVGASDSYYFPPFVAAMLFAVTQLQDCPPLLHRIGMAAYATLSIGLVFFLLLGSRGTIILNGHVEETRQIATELNRMPAPKLVWDETAALPWFTQGVETRIFWNGEANMLIGGSFDPHKAVADGHYATVAIPADTQSSFDLSRYKSIETINGLEIFERAN
jgi:hypothetical protein